MLRFVQKIVGTLDKSLSYPGSLVLDFFAGSGTTGRVCIEHKRHCLLCDQDPLTLEYFARHIKNAREQKELEFIRFDDLECFLAALNVLKVKG
ncbi:MAG: hypothetical protein IAB19_05365 [Proteobacteria bacterium]|uniref:DNA methylase N-4/N-6 domain-containing protein n=1 Tax=Candidatus Avisuccinivibrio stercorigallinarum TaxID=2840704 RepID=A0A9D9DCA1_9GAMM|nr:hypothetical protein [Candidatus Avisuccinivibrio stercorigallinarum]